jgi:hypothetical protein
VIAMLDYTLMVHDAPCVWGDIFQTQNRLIVANASQELILGEVPLNALLVPVVFSLQQVRQNAAPVVRDFILLLDLPNALHVHQAFFLWRNLLAAQYVLLAYILKQKHLLDACHVLLAFTLLMDLLNVLDARQDLIRQ